MAKDVSNSNWFMKHKLVTAVLAIIILAVIFGGGKSTKDKTKSNSSTPTITQSASTKPPEKPAERQTVGTAVTLGAGTFSGGQDVAVGLYDVTSSAGQSGNFIVNDGTKVNEVLGTSGGLGVSKVRTNIAKDDVIKISGLSQVIFTPVSAPFVTSHASGTLYSGAFIVGEDIGEGKYVVAPGNGESGNFIVNDGAKVNEVLGSTDGLGVPSVTVTLSKGDTVKISGLNTVSLTAQ